MGLPNPVPAIALPEDLDGTGSGPDGQVWIQRWIGHELH